MDLNAYRRIILYGGNFDPPHMAHVTLPVLVKRQVGADVVVYIPSGVGPFKRNKCQTPAHHRTNMLRLALEGLPHVVVLTDEVDRTIEEAETRLPGTEPQPTYTVDTIQTLRQRLDPEVELRLLIGADHLKTFDQWHQPDRLIELAEPLVMVRPPETHQTVLSSLPPQYDPQQWASRIVDVPSIDISSSYLRGLASHGMSLSGFVSPKVETYIREHHLYQDS